MEPSASLNVTLLGAQSELACKPMSARVLIIEDEPIQAITLETTVSSLGHTVCAVAAKGEDAVTSAAIQLPDLLIVDVSLPGVLDGIGAAERIRQLRPCAIIFRTGHNSPATVQRMRKLNPVEILFKPTTQADLAHAIAKALKGAYGGAND